MCVWTDGQRGVHWRLELVVYCVCLLHSSLCGMEGHPDPINRDPASHIYTRKHTLHVHRRALSYTHTHTHTHTYTHTHTHTHTLGKAQKHSHTHTHTDTHTHCCTTTESQTPNPTCSTTS